MIRTPIPEHQLDDPFSQVEWAILLLLCGVGGFVAFMFDLL